jgi:hypothetical protein
VIREKLLSGYFGKDRSEERVGWAVDRRGMFRDAMANGEAVAMAIRAAT